LIRRFLYTSCASTAAIPDIQATTIQTTPQESHAIAEATPARSSPTKLIPTRIQERRRAWAQARACGGEEAGSPAMLRPLLVVGDRIPSRTSHLDPSNPSHFGQRFLDVAPLRTRVSVAIQLTSQLLPPSSENACSNRAVFSSSTLITKRTRMARPPRVSGP